MPNDSDKKDRQLIDSPSPGTPQSPTHECDFISPPSGRSLLASSSKTDYSTTPRYSRQYSDNSVHLYHRIKTIRRHFDSTYPSHLLENLVSRKDYQYFILQMNNVYFFNISTRLWWIITICWILTSTIFLIINLSVGLSIVLKGSASVTTMQYLLTFIPSVGALFAVLVCISIGILIAYLIHCNNRLDKLRQYIDNSKKHFLEIGIEITLVENEALFNDEQPLYVKEGKHTISIDLQKIDDEKEYQLLHMMGFSGHFK